MEVKFQENKYKVDGIDPATTILVTAIAAVAFLFGAWPVGAFFAVCVALYVLLNLIVKPFAKKTITERLDFDSKEYIKETASIFERQVFRAPFHSISELTLEIDSDLSGGIMYYILVWSEMGRFKLPYGIMPSVSVYDRHSMEAARWQLAAKIKEANIR